MKQSTFSAFVANNLLTVLQGYTKGKRLIAVLTLLLTVGIGQVWGATETLSCTKGTVSNNTMTFSTTNFTFVHAKADGSSFAAYTPWRVYADNTVTITAGSGVSSIDKIEIVHSGTYYSSISSSSGSVTMATTSGGTTTINSTSGKSITLTVTGSSQSRWTSIKVTYTAASADPHTVTLKDDNSTLTQSSAGATITLPSRDGCDGYEFVGWTKSWSVAQTTWTTTAPTIIPTGSYTPTDNENLYPVYTKTESGTLVPATLTASYSSHSGWTATSCGGSSYWVLKSGASITSPVISDLSTVTSITFKVRTYGGSSYKTVNVSTSGGTSIGSASASSTTLTSKTINASNLSGSGSIVFSSSTTSSSYGPGINDITINYSTGGSTTSYISVPDCTTETAVTLNPNGGSGGTEEVTATKGESMPSITLPTRTGYTFNGYYTATSGGTKYYNADGTSAKNWDKDDETFTLYAQWICTSPTNLQITGEYIRFPGQPIELTVTGDNIADDATYTWMKGNVEIENQTSATLTINSCTINDAGNYVCQVSNGSCVSTCNFTIKMYRLMGLDDDTWTTPHEFIYSGSGTIATLTKTLSRDTTYEFKLNDGQDWYGNTGTMTYNNCTNWVIKQNTDLDYNTKITTTAAGTYIFTLDYTNAANPKLSVTYPQKKMVYLNPGPWDVDGAKMSVHAWVNGVGNEEDILMTKVEDCNTDRTIYQAEIAAEQTHVIFIRGSASYTTSDPWNNIWNRTGDLTIDNEQYNIYNWDFSNSTWTTFTPNYSVTFDVQGHGTDTAPENQCIAEGDTATTPTAPTAEGYTFGGWYTDQACNNAYDFSTAVTSSITLYAKWTINTHTLTWDVNGGNPLTGEYTQGSVDYGTPIVQPTDPTLTGHTFLGWKETDGSTTIAETMPDKDLTYTAQWQICLYTLTWDLNGGTVTTAGTCAAVGATGSLSGDVEYGASITAPIVEREGYRFDGWDTEPATTMGTTDLTYTAQWTKVYTVTFYSNGSPYETLTDLESGDAVTFPANDPESCDTDHYPHFIGWTTNPIDGSTTTQPDLVTSATVSDEDLEYHAVFAAGTQGTTSTKVDVLNRATTGVTGTSYAEWSGKTATSTAVYAGQSAGGNESIQLRSKESNSGIITTASGGKVTKVVVTWNSNTASGRTLDIYGKNSAYTAATDLYNSSTQGTKLGSIVNGTSTELTITDDYEYIGLRSNSGAMYLDEIQITWSAGSAANYTSFITSCCAATANLVLTPNPESPIALDIDGNASTTISFATENSEAALYYRPTITPSENTSLTINGTWNNYTSSAGSYTYNFTATGTYTIKQEFKQDGYDCKKSASTTITVAANPILQVSEPTITSECGTEGMPVAVTIDSRYLTGSSLTAQVATTTDTEHGVFKICTTEDGDFATTDLTRLSAGKDDKATVTIYVCYDAAVDNIDDAEGTLTITDGTTSQTVDLTTTPTCGTSIRMTPTDANSVRVTTANGQWTRTQTAIHLRGSYLLQNLIGDQGAKVELTSSNSNFKFVKPDVASSGTVKYESEKITNNTWEADVYLVYTPTSYDANETTTITAKVTTFGGTTEHATATLTAYGRSFPETFVLALYTGSKWVALPADMIAPYGDCTTGVGNHDPYPITVNDNDNPTTATLAPARAVYKGAARNTPTTNPWTIQFESNTQAGYYLFGSVHNDDANTSIANLAQATGEGLKWELNTEDNITYRLSQMNAPAFQLGYNATANYMGQYQSTATNFKYDFRILPVTSTCTYYIEPIMTLVDYTDDEAKVRIQYDGTNLYQISTDNKANWTNVEGEIDCLDLTFTLPNSTYRGKDVWLKPQGDLCEPVESSASCHIPAPVINNPGDQNFVGTVNQPFSGTFTITGSDFYQDISAITITNNSNPAIGATINNGTITVTMAAAAVGTYTTNLTFDAVGAEDVIVKVTITIQDLAIMQITPANITDGYCCLDGSAPAFTFSPIYVNGSAITTAGGASNGTNTFSVIDLDNNNATVNATYSVSSGAVTLTVPLANLTLTHRYQVSYTNLNDGDKTLEGLPYANASYTFTAINCNTITALPACPITNSGFTANWVGNATKLNVYTKAETEVLAAAMTETTINVWKRYSNSYADKWLGASSDGTDNITTSSTYGAKVAGSGESGYIYTPQLGTLKADMTNSTEFEVTITVYHYNSNSNKNSIKCFVIDGEPTNTTEPTSGNNVYFNGTQNTSWTSTTFGNVNTTDVTFIVSGLTSTSRIAITATNRINSTYVKNLTIKSVATSSVGEYDVTGTSHDVSGLDPNTQYYYTVSDGTNTSNEIAVTTYENAPSLKFYSDEACTAEIDYTTVLGGEETTVYVEGTKVPGCDIATSVSSGYGMDDSGLNYNVTTGAVTGSIILTLTDANATEGTLTLTDGKGNTYVLPIVSSDCPAGFGTMALPASDIKSESAQANWTSTLNFGDDKSGTLHLYKNGIVNRELIVNGDFETGTLDAGWSKGLNEGDMDAVYSFEEYAIANSNANGGSNCLYVSEYGSELPNFQNMSVMYADSITLTPGTYTMSAWVKVPNKEGNDKKVQFALGLIGGKKSEVKVVCVSDITIVQSNNTYVQLTYEFTLTSTVTACPAIGAKQDAGECRTFYIDDVSLMCTYIGQSDEPYLSIDIADLSEDGFLALTGLSGNTEYTYVIQNADGCSSNPITFQTTEAGAPVITPYDVTISCQVGNSVNGLMTLSVKDVYSDIYISNSCTERITLNTTELPKEGGVVNFTFTPLNTDQGGETGTCTISFTTKGLATPATGIITWTVTAGKDPDQPIVEVVDITNASMDIEHNQGNGNDVHIVISREKGEDEIEENLGEEIFFSKYYEAYMHKKLWAIYNPTDHKISLANTYVWRSNGNSDDWNIEGGMDLSSLGNIEPGYIHPNEEIIIYTSDQVGECEQGKADMSDWVAMSSSDPALSFSGNDALLLVRKADGTNDPPKQSVDEYGNSYELPWRKYTAADDTQWWMLDIIGARKTNNTPDNSETYKWTWTCNGKTETGDADGWVGTGEHLDATLYTDCPYILSTNRCLLIRKMTVKSGCKAIQTNVNDMFTLNTEWRGVHVPLAGDQAQVSCENFSFVGGYDYDGYYNAWTPIDEMSSLEATQNDDGSYTVTPINMPQYYCHPLRIEVYITENVNGEEIDNVKAYLDYKVPIVVDEDVTTNDTRYFVEPTRENVLSPEICAECDVVIRDAATLTHIDDGREAFRNMQVYPTAKFNIPENLSMQLEGLHMYAKNDDVGYAILNDNGSSIHADNIVHIKRIDDVYWYPFSLPYDCNVSSIYQLNGKSMGEYWVDWGIKYYNGHERQVIGDDYTAGATSDFWKKLEPDQTLKAHQGYIIGLFTTEWTGQMKSIYFPPVESTEYTENSGESKTTYISNWPENLDCEPRHRGWNFTSLPYISLFSSQNGDGTTNSNSLMMGSQTDPYATSSTVYVSIPDGGDSRTYTQVSAAATKLEPFKPYFVQAIDPTDGQSHNDITLTYSKGGRTLEKMPARAASNVRPTIVVEMRIANADASLVDNAGVLVSERYTANYEIAADLTKMYAADRKPQLFTRAANNNEMLAYNALPAPLAQNIPLGIYLPNNDEYTISIIDYASQLSDAEAVYLLHNGEIVANLLYADYTIPTQQAGLINGYSLDIRRRQDTTTNIDNIADGGPVITVVDGQIVIQQLPEDAQLYITDVLGRVLYQQANVPQIITFQAPVTGVYNVVITTAEQQFTQKTIVR